VVLQAPGGTEHLIVLEVCYERISVKPFREPPGAEASAKKLPADDDRPDEGERWHLKIPGPAKNSL
jgi:transcription elongation factor GreB